MSESKYDIGREYYKKVYANMLPDMPDKGFSDFTDNMMENLFATVWAAEDKMSIKDRRLVIMGIIMATGSPELFGIQARAALLNKELNFDELEQIIITGTQYVGYPRSATLSQLVRGLKSEFEKE